MASGTLCAVKTRRAPSRTSAGRVASAARRVLGERLDESGVVEVAADLVDAGRAGPAVRARPVNVVQVLPAARERTVGRGGEGQRVPDAVGGHRGHGAGQVGVPVPVPPVDGQVEARGAELGAQGGDEVPALLVDRAHAATA